MLRVSEKSLCEQMPGDCKVHVLVFLSAHVSSTLYASCSWFFCFNFAECPTFSYICMPVFCIRKISIISENWYNYRYIKITRHLYGPKSLVFRNWASRIGKRNRRKHLLLLLDLKLGLSLEELQIKTIKSSP